MVQFEWDETKAESNRRKHGIGFELASEVFDDPYAVAEQDRIEGDEERWQTIGSVEGLIVVFVGHTIREQGQDEIIRIITARKATRKEREYYDKNRKKNVG
ncbi:MAG: BrnT family toxin [Acidobacteriaceae bacterium]